MSDKPSLDGAYSANTPDEHRKLYRDWAKSYDRTFALSHDYRQHNLVAEAFCEAQGTGPVLDIGAGTGLVGQALAERGVGPLDATDLSPEMLEVAQGKGVYRDLITANLLEGLPIEDATYTGITSAGTFTHGHLGPEVFPELFRVAASGAVFALTINAKHFEFAGFGDALASSTMITGLVLKEVAIYGEKATGAHAQDTSLIATFQKI